MRLWLLDRWRRLRSSLWRRGADQVETDQIRVVVDLGLDGLVTTAADAGASPALALARVANEVAARPEAAGRLDEAIRRAGLPRLL